MYTSQWLAFDYVNEEIFSDFRMYAVHTDSLYIDFSRTFLKSTIRIFIYGKWYVQNGEFSNPVATGNPTPHSFSAISGFPHVMKSPPGKPHTLFSYFDVTPKSWT